MDLCWPILEPGFPWPGASEGPARRLPVGRGLPKRQRGFARRAGSASAGPGSTGALPQVGHKRRPMALRRADPARRCAVRFPRPGISPSARGAEGGKAAPGVPQGAFCDQLSVDPPGPRRAASGGVRVNGGLTESSLRRAEALSPSAFNPPPQAHSDPPKGRVALIRCSSERLTDPAPS